LESAFTIIKSINKRAFLEIEFKDEIGTGLGPTLEFYSLLSDELRNQPLDPLIPTCAIWRKSMPDNSLFPSPLSIQVSS
jgi:hypothetical protein